MEIRNLGRSGLRVSTIGLGCNNFGGRIDEAATKAVIHKALDLGITLFDTADVYGERGGSETADGPNTWRRPQADRAGHQIRHANGRQRRKARRLPPLHHGSGRGQSAPSADRLHRPVSDAPDRSAHPDRGNPARAGRPDPPGKGALHRLLQLSCLADDRGSLDRSDGRTERLCQLPGRIFAGPAPAGGRAVTGGPAAWLWPAALFPTGQRPADRQVPPQCGSARRHAAGQHAPSGGPLPHRAQLDDRRAAG